MKKLDLETKFQTGTKGRFTGLGSVYGNVDLGGDIVVYGAFAESAAAFSAGQRKVQMLWQHDASEPIGVWKSIRETRDGLEVEGQLLLETRRGREAHELMKADVLGLSVGFQLKDFDFDRDGNRLIKSAELWEISAVTFPMNPRAVVDGVKSEALDKRAFEYQLRERLGLSRGDARAIASKGYSELAFVDEMKAAENQLERKLRELAREIRSYQ